MWSKDTNNQPPPKSIMCVHTQADEPFYHELQIHLSLWQREGYIQWLEIAAGSDMEHTMQAYLQQTHLILLLISPDFFAHDPCYQAMHIALQERARRQVPVVPVLARASSWKGSICGGLLALPGNEQPIAEWAHPEQAYEGIRSGLARLLPGDGKFRQKLMQGTARPGAAPQHEEARQHEAPAQPGSVNIGKVKSNQGQIGRDFYGDIHNNQH